MKYPIFRIAIQWVEGSYRTNGTSFYKMYKEFPDFEEVTIFAESWWRSYNLSHVCGNLVSLSVEYIGDYSWCLTWFSHYTYDNGQTDMEFLDSFEEFVQGLELDDSKYCLMGADERWRWKGVCRCVHCKEKGRVTIDH